MATGITDRITTVDSGRIPGIHRWVPGTASNKTLNPKTLLDFTFELDTTVSNRRRLGVPFARDTPMSPYCFAINSDGKVIITCGHWDSTFKCISIENSKQIQSIGAHKDVVTCLDIGTNGKILVTGSKDTTVMVWEAVTKSNTFKVIDQPLHLLSGHNDEVTCVALNIDLDIVVSGSKDGSCIIHALRQGEYIRSLWHPNGAVITQLAISSMGHIIFYSQEDLCLYMYSINGKLLKIEDTHERLNHMIISKKAEYIITGGYDKTVTVRRLYDLKCIHKFATNSIIQSLALTIEERHLFVGLDDGKLLIFAVDFTKLINL